MIKKFNSKCLQLVILGVAIIFIYPILSTFICSFKQNNDNFILQGYLLILMKERWFLTGFWNSVGYSVVITFLNLIVAVPAAYAFCELQFKWKNVLYVIYIFLILMPLQVTLLPNYMQLRDMGLLDTRWAILLPGIFAPFGEFLFIQYLNGSSKTIIEAARLETNSVVKILLYVIVPQLKVCIFAAAVFIFAENWNMVEQPTIFLSGKDRLPLSVILASVENIDVNVLFSGAIIFLIPPIILYMYFHESLEKGLGVLKI